MKEGDLVKCLFQPTVGRVQHGVALPMLHTIIGEMGFYIRHKGKSSGVVYFPHLGYEHVLSWSSLEVISESR